MFTVIKLTKHSIIKNFKQNFQQFMGKIINKKKTCKYVGDLRVK